MQTASTVNVFEYLDYRAFLRDHYAREKQRNRGFSHRAFSRRAGLRSVNYLHLVAAGRRNLSPEMARRFARGCALDGQAAEYFRALVAYTQARGVHERNECFRQLMRFRDFRQVHQLRSEQAEYHTHWYIPAIRELAARSDFRDDARWVASMMRPRINAAQAREALGVLERLGLLVRTSDGTLRQAERLVTTGPGPLGHHVVSYHRAMLERASEALDNVPREQRQISSLTLCVSEETARALAARITEFRKELLQLAELEGEPERVVQIGFQLFPLSAGKESAS